MREKELKKKGKKKKKKENQTKPPNQPAQPSNQPNPPILIFCAAQKSAGPSNLPGPLTPLPSSPRR
jgi:hypothetical protein